MYKNLDSQYVLLYAYNRSDGVGESGDNGNFTIFVVKDNGDENPAANAATEVDAANCPGLYRLELSQAETSADIIAIFATSSTPFVWIDPIILQTQPTNAPSMVSGPATEAKQDTAISAIGTVDGKVDTVTTDVGTVDGKVDTVQTDITAIGAKTTNLPASPAATGAEMDLVDAPNGTAIVAIQSGLAVPGDNMGLTSAGIDALLATTVDTEAISNILKFLLSLVGGKIVVDDANDLIKLYAQDGTTLLITWNYSSGTAREVTIA